VDKWSTIEAGLGRTILESLPVGLYVVDNERRILLWSDGAEKISGYLRHEVVGRSCRDNVLAHCDEHGTVLCGIACPLDETIHDGHPRERGVYMRHKAGHRMPVYVRALPVRNEHGTVIGAVELFEEQNSPPADERRELSFASGNPLDREGLEALLAAGLLDLEQRRVPFAVISLDIGNLDHFARMYGCLAVKEASNVVARTVIRCVRRPELLGWWSQKQLVAILPHCVPAALPEIVERLRELAAQTAVSWWGERHSLQITVNATEARAGDTVESILARCEANS
jgi:PAS domain S-box-containing protein